METVVFKDWLEERGLLVPFLRNMLDARDNRDWCARLNIETPLKWVDKAFLWETTPEEHLRWAKTCEAWEFLVRDRNCPVEAGMPLEDDMGLRLMLAGLEENDD